MQGRQIISITNNPHFLILYWLCCVCVGSKVFPRQIPSNPRGMFQRRLAKENPDCWHFPVSLSAETTGKNNHCHLELEKRTFQLVDPNKLSVGWSKWTVENNFIESQNGLSWEGPLKSLSFQPHSESRDTSESPFADFVLSHEKASQKSHLRPTNISFDLKVTDLWRLSHLINFYLQCRSVLFPSMKSKEVFQVRKSNIF